MARIKEPTIAELMTASRQAAKHLQAVKRRVQEQITALARAWQAEHFPVPDGVNVFMRGDECRKIDPDEIKYADGFKFHWGDLTADGDCIVTFKMPMGVTGDRWGFRYTGTCIEPATEYSWNDPAPQARAEATLKSMWETINNYKQRHHDAITLASGTEAGWKTPKLGDLLADLAAGVFGANHNRVFNLIQWSTYVSGRSKKAGQLYQSVYIKTMKPTNIAEEIKKQRMVDEYLELFAGTRYQLEQNDAAGQLVFKPCEPPKRTDTGDKRNATNYLKVSDRKYLP